MNTHVTLSTRCRHLLHSRVVLLLYLIIFAAIGTILRSPAQARSESEGLDIILLIDVSSSMLDNDPDNLTRRAARLFVDLLGEQERAGIVLFGRGAEELQGLTHDKEELRMALNDPRLTPVPGAPTDMCLGLQQAYSQLRERSAGEQNRRGVVLLFTDGRPCPTWGSPTEGRQCVQEQIPEFGNSGWQVYPIGLFVPGCEDPSLHICLQCDEDLLEAIAQGTDAKYWQTQRAEELPGLYRDALAAILDLRQDAVPGPTEERYDLPPGTKTMIAIAESDVDLEALGCPDVVSLLGPGSAVARFEKSCVERFFIKRIDGPEPGLWMVRSDKPDSVRLTGLLADVQYEIELEVTPAAGDSCHCGRPLDLEARLLFEGSPVEEETVLSGAVVAVEIARDGETDRTVVLDRAPGDQWFRGVYTPPIGEPGTYIFRPLIGRLMGSGEEVELSCTDLPAKTLEVTSVGPCTVSVTYPLAPEVAETTTETVVAGQQRTFDVFLGTTVILEAHPTDGCSGFDFWVVDADQRSAEPKREITVAADHSATVTCSERGPFDVVVEIPSEAVGTVARWPEQDSYPCGSTVRLEAQSARCWSFSGWKGDLSSADTWIEMIVYDDIVVEATFEPEEYPVDIVVIGQGAVAQEPDLDAYRCGDEIALAATPEEGWLFKGWSGDLDGTEPSLSVIVDGELSATALFAAQAVLTVTCQGEPTIDLGIVQKPPIGSAAVLSRTCRLDWDVGEVPPHVTVDLLPAPTNAAVLEPGAEVWITEGARRVGSLDLGPAADLLEVGIALPRSLWAEVGLGRHVFEVLVNLEPANADLTGDVRWEDSQATILLTFTVVRPLPWPLWALLGVIPIVTTVLVTRPRFPRDVVLDGIGFGRPLAGARPRNWWTGAVDVGGDGAISLGREDGRCVRIGPSWHGSVLGRLVGMRESIKYTLTALEGCRIHVPGGELSAGESGAVYEGSRFEVVTSQGTYSLAARRKEEEGEGHMGLGFGHDDEEDEIGFPF